VDSVEVKDIRNTPFDGVQHGLAIYSYADDGTARTMNVYNSIVSGFQKNGITLNADTSTPLTVDIRNNTINGWGATDKIAQNGIEVWADQGTGVIDSNAITGIGYDNTNDSTKWVATSILPYFSDLTITNNTVTGAQVGVYNILGNATIDGNNITVDLIGNGGDWGIIATDPPNAVPAPFDSDTMQQGSTLSTESANAVYTADIKNNTVTFNGSSNTGTFGIEVDTGWGPDEIGATITNNTVTGFEVGIEVYQGTDYPDVHFTSVTATNNCLSGNGYGMRSNADYMTVDGTNNWWGDASGPYHATKNPYGTGDEVSDYIAFEPYLDSCGGNATGNWKNVTTGGLYATLQSALDNASSGDVISPVEDNEHGGATSNTSGVTIDLDGKTAGPGSPFLTVASADVTVKNGVLNGGGSTDPAILVVSGGDNFILEDVEVTGWEDGVEIQNSVASFKMASNWVHDNTDAGLQLDNGVALSGIVTIEGNLFKANGGNGVQNDSGNLLDATYNSWGDNGGPAGTNGDGVSSNVTYDPWTFSEVYMDVDPDNEAIQRDVDESVSFDVALKVDAVNLYGVTFKFTFDPTMLQYNSITFASPWAGNCFDAGSDTANGVVSYACNLLSGSEWTDAHGKVATINFTATGSGLTGNGPWTTYFDIAHDVADTSSGAKGGVKVFVNNAGYGAPSTADRDITDTNDGQIDITGIGNYTGYIDLQGRTDDSGATLTVYDQQAVSGSTALADGTSASSGKYTTAYIGSNLLTIGDTYWFQVDASLYLPTTIKNPMATDWSHSKLLDTRPLTTLNNVVLLGGDATDDDTIDISDATCIGNDYGTSTSTCGTGSSDVNGDGVIDILDLVLMGGNYGLSDSPWTP
jgi:hypothetical protein